jgi:hypothetical protein
VKRVPIILFAFGMVAICDCGTQQPCPTANFASINTNMFQPNCTFSSCHQAGANSSVGNLDLATDPYRALLGPNGKGVEATDPVGTSYTYNSMLLVKPGDASQSLLYLKLSQTGPSGCPQSSCRYGEQMPYASTPLPQCYLDAVKHWIESDAGND